MLRRKYDLSIKAYPTFRHAKIGAMTSNRMTLSITTLGIMKRSTMALSVRSLCMMTLTTVTKV